MRPDCGQCVGCKGMTKFGGNGKAKQACINRKCPNMGAEDEEEDGLSEEDENVKELPKESPAKKVKAKVKDADVVWEGDGVTIGRKTYYESAVLGGEFTVSNGDTVLISPEDSSHSLYVATVAYMLTMNWSCIVRRWLNIDIRTASVTPSKQSLSIGFGNLMRISLYLKMF